jgi:hypothetical protein
MYKIADISTADYDKYVGLLTVEQKDLLIGQIFAPYSYFNPIQDADNNWIISVEEMNQCVNEQFMWVRDLPLIPFNPKIEQMLWEE